MDFSILAKNRYSVRSFKSDAVEEDKIAEILDAGLIAPSACNFQPWRIYVAKSEEARKKLSGICRFTFDAPLIMVICYDNNLTWKNKRIPGHSSGETDASILTTHMILKASELGIGSCWVGCFNPTEVKEALGISEDSVVVSALVPMGYPKEDSAPHEMHTKYRDKSETVFEV